MDGRSEGDVTRYWSRDVIHEFFAIFLSIWASLMLSDSNFTLRNALFVLVYTAVPIFLLVRSFGRRENLFVRWWQYLGVGAFVALATGALIQLFEEQDQQVYFLALIVVAWIITFEATNYERLLDDMRWRREWIR